ncbi:MAG TPA: hypothetical protein VFL88_00305 [Gemmatimonadales bacterium]|jgi:hypothetical protein|nr:hypothetical protein [Gemmatimonadales bacterium]
MLPSHRLLPLALMALAACSSATDRGPSIAQFHLSDTALVTIPDAAPDGRYTMSTITGASQARDGAVAVWTASNEVYLFDSTGAYVDMPGRKGNGPGELRAIGGVGECSEGTFTVWDPMGRHLLLIDATHGSVRDRNPGVQELITRFAGCQEGHPVIVYWPFDFSSQELKQESLAVVRLDTAGTSLDTIYVGNGVLHAGPVMQLFPVIPAVRARADLLVVGDNTTDILRRWHGERQDSVPIRMARQPVTAAAADSMKRLWYDLGNPNSTQSKTIHAMIDRAWSKLPAPDSIPLFSELLIDDSASVWISDYVAGQMGLGSAHVGRWIRLSNDGAPAATLELPSNFNLMQFTHGRALGIHENEDGSLAVELREIEKS